MKESQLNEGPQIYYRAANALSLRIDSVCCLTSRRISWLLLVKFTLKYGGRGLMDAFGALI
ncbi:hypothetical protein SDJN02_21408, partial [Cucurbita argyrosperma subsp. argyrosperma]